MSGSVKQDDDYATLSQKVLGYKLPQVARLHLNRINGDTIDRILDLYIQRGFRFVTFEAPQADPAYAIPTTYATRFGPMWAYRWAKEKGVRFDGSLEQEPPSWLGEYACARTERTEDGLLFPSPVDRSACKSRDQVVNQ